MNILLLSAYEAVSHRFWREGLVGAFPEHQFDEWTMAPRHFSWRIRGNALHFADLYHQHVKESKTLSSIGYDLIIATSMVDLSTLKGLVPQLAAVPSLLYFHENQFAFPQSKHAYRSVEPMMVNLYAALAADRLCFNSDHNKHTFLHGVQTLLKKFPDYVPSGLGDTLCAKSEILPVPLQDDVFDVEIRQQCSATHRSPAVCTWNHRWEYDKGPERLLGLIEALPATWDMRFNIVGQRFSREPNCMQQIKVLLVDRGWLGVWGPVENRADYLALLSESDIVLSTALHDFQGLSVLEAMALGCTPIVPDRLAYQEYVPTIYRYYSSGTDANSQERVKEAISAAKLVERVVNAIGCDDTEDSRPLSFSWNHMKSKYEAAFQQIVSE